MKTERVLAFALCFAALTGCSAPESKPDLTVYWNPATKVVKSSKALKAGQPITAELLKEEDIPSGSCPLDALTKDECVGKVARRDLEEGDCLTLALVQVSPAEVDKLRHWVPVPADYKGKTLGFVVAKSSVAKGTQLSSDVMEEKQAAERSAAVGAVLNPGAAVGYYTTVDVPAGIPLVNADLTTTPPSAAESSAK